MEVLAFLVELERVLGEGRRVPFTGKVMVDEEEAMALLADVKSHLPDDLRQAQRMVVEKERLLQEARQEAERLVEEGRKRAVALLEESSLVAQAQSQAQDVVERARQVAREIRAGALEYAGKVLGDAAAALQAALDTLNKGRDELKASK